MTPENSAAQSLDRTSGSDLAVAVPSEQISVQLTQPATEVPELVARAKAGDRQAFAALYRTYLPTVYKFLYYRMGNNKAVAEDMTAEVFLRALRKVEDFNWTGADFGSWLLRIARNLVLDNAKSSRARLEILNDEMPEDAAGQARSTESSVMENLTNQGVYQAIKQLSPDQRDVVTMRFIQGLDVGEVAAAMGKKEGTIRTLQFRGLKALQKLLVKGGVVDVTDTTIRPEGVRVSANGRSGDRTESEAARFGIAEGDR
jgi:RNA polymerase sigma-70 factor (ECF subfamily)